MTVSFWTNILHEQRTINAVYYGELLRKFKTEISIPLHLLNKFWKIFVGKLLKPRLVTLWPRFVWATEGVLGGEKFGNDILNKWLLTRPTTFSFTDIKKLQLAGKSVWNVMENMYKNNISLHVLIIYIFLNISHHLCIFLFLLPLLISTFEYPQLKLQFELYFFFLRWVGIFSSFFLIIPLNKDSQFFNNMKLIKTYFV